MNFLFTTFCSAAGIDASQVPERISLDTSWSAESKGTTAPLSPKSVAMVPLTNRWQRYFRSWPGWITGGVLGLAVIIAVIYLVKNPPQDQTAFTPLMIPTTERIVSVPNPTSTYRGIPTKTATPIPTRIPSATPIPTVTNTPSPPAPQLTSVKRRMIQISYSYRRVTL